MLSPSATTILEDTIDQLLGKPDAILSAKDIRFLAVVLGPLFPEYSLTALETKIAKMAVERDDRKVEWKRWDS